MGKISQLKVTTNMSNKQQKSAEKKIEIEKPQMGEKLNIKEKKES